MDIVCFSINNWEKRRARKQQFMTHLAEWPDVGRVLYVEPAVNFLRLVFLPFRELRSKENRARWKRALCLRPLGVSPKFFVYTPFYVIPFGFRFYFIYKINLRLSLVLVRRLLVSLRFRDITLWLYHPFDAPLLEWFWPRCAAIFDWAESWADYFMEYKGALRDRVRVLEERIVEGADRVFVVSQRLLERAQKINPMSFLLRDGTSPEIFAQNVPFFLEGVRHPVAGYIGTIFERMDVALMEEVAARMPDWMFVFVGSVHEHRVDVSGLRARPNVCFFDAVDYARLPGFFAHFDVALIPYRHDLDLVPPPTKVFDYLAGGKPIVATGLSELDFLGDFIDRADGPEAFEAALRRAQSQDSPDKQAARREMARRNSWAARAEEIVGHLREEGARAGVVIIPHHPDMGDDLKIRLVELAWHMRRRHRVYLAHWRAARRTNIFERLKTVLYDSFQRFRFYRDRGMWRVQVPMVHLPWARGFNFFRLKRFLVRIQPRLVVNGAYAHFGGLKVAGLLAFRYVVDLADLPDDEQRGHLKRNRAWLREFAAADLMTVASLSLVHFVKEEYRRSAIFLPNGADIDRFARISPGSVRDWRRSQGLEGKWVISHIGYLGSWVDMDFMVNVFRKVRRRVPEAVLWVIGGGPSLAEWRVKYKEDGIVFSGFMPSAMVESSFLAADIGVLPNKKILFQDMAFHIKIIEYGAARRIVIATPLEELERQAFPFVRCVPLDEDAWVDALLDAKGAAWQEAWDARVKEFDWSAICERLRAVAELT